MALSERCCECGRHTSLPVLCRPCRVAFADVSPETCPWPPDEPREVVMAQPVRWAVPVPYVSDVTQDDYSELEIP